MSQKFNSLTSIFFLLIAQILLFTAEVKSTEELIKYCNSTLANDKKGLCINFDHKLKDCPPLLSFLRERKFGELQKTICEETGASFEKSWVCCPLNEYNDLSDSFGHHPNFKLLPSPKNSACGQSTNTDRIIGGYDAKPGEFNWMARIAMTREEEGSEELEFVCGGSIISKKYILSAAHCFKEKGTKLSKVRVGDTSDDTEIECIEISNTTICEKQEDLEVEEVITHPGYTGNAGSQNDIALVRLKQEIRNISSLLVGQICLPFSKEFGIPPIPIPASGARGGQLNAIVAGWGKLYNSDNEGSPDLQYLPVPLTDNIQCGNAFRANNVTISDQQICAGGEKGKGSCAGDSGSPLFFPVKLKGKTGIRNLQIGVVSFGKFQCAGTGSVVYTRVRKYLSWILDNIRE